MTLKEKDYSPAQTIPQCMHCGSYVGEMKRREFHCKSCGKASDQPEEVWPENNKEHNPKCGGIIEHLKSIPPKKRCRKCGWTEATGPGRPAKVKPTPDVNPSAATPEKELTTLLEAYDTGTAPFHNESEARDLYEQIEGILDSRIDEAVHEAERVQEDKLEKEADEYRAEHMAERKQALTEAVCDACAPHLTGLGEDIVKLIEEYMTCDE